MYNSRRMAASLAAVVTGALVVGAAVAAEGVPCAVRVNRTNLVPCALAASLVVRGERQELDAAAARKVAASPLLPSNPVLALSGATRTSPVEQAYDWSATLSQEIEVAGQRGLRRAAAEASVAAQSNRVLLSRREAAALAWVAFYDALAAAEEQRLADRLATVARAVAAVARARAESGLNAPVDADVADAAAVRALQEKFAADRRSSRAGAELASLWGLDPSQASLSVEGELIPIPEVVRALASDPAEGLAERPELLVVEGERRALELRADSFRRTRIPNPTVSLFAQRDGFDERVLGLGISFPIPLPGGVGHTNAGEIAEAEALARRATVDRERIERELRLEVANARQAFVSRAKEVELFTPERSAGAETTLVALGQEVEAGRLSVRDAIIAQQSLIELLRANVEVRWAWCLASVDLARALGFPLEGRAP